MAKISTRSTALSPAGVPMLKYTLRPAAGVSVAIFSFYYELLRKASI